MGHTLAQHAEKLHPAHPGHLQVGQDNPCRLIRQSGERLFPARGSPYLCGLVCEGFRQGGQDSVVIVDDEQRASHETQPPRNERERDAPVDPPRREGRTVRSNIGRALHGSHGEAWREGGRFRA